MGTFVDTMDRLLEEIPDEIEMGVEVDQVYAHYQHEHPEFHHPDGGQAFYLRDPLFTRASVYMHRVAEQAIGHHGVDVFHPMVENAEDLSLEVYNRAPWEFGDLRASGHPTVTEDGTVTYDRAPRVHRLSDTELADKAHLRYLFDPHRYGRGTEGR